MFSLQNRNSGFEASCGFSVQLDFHEFVLHRGLVFGCVFYHHGRVLYRVAMFSKKMEQMAAMLYFLNLVFGLLYHVRLVRQGAVEQLLKTVWKVAEDTTLSQSCKFF